MTFLLWVLWVYFSNVKFHVYFQNQSIPFIGNEILKCSSDIPSFQKDSTTILLRQSYICTYLHREELLSSRLIFKRNLYL